MRVHRRRRGRLGHRRELPIADTRKGKDAQGRPTAHICHLPAPGAQELLAELKPGARLTARIDWARRHRLMRLHTSATTRRVVLGFA